MLLPHSFQKTDVHEQKGLSHKAETQNIIATCGIFTLTSMHLCFWTKCPLEIIKHDVLMCTKIIEWFKCTCISFLLETFQNDPPVKSSFYPMVKACRADKGT